jgi:hypothetical protein
MLASAAELSNKGLKEDSASYSLSCWRLLSLSAQPVACLRPRPRLWPAFASELE